MKKTLCMILALVFACACILGCGGKSEEKTEQSEATLPPDTVQENNVSDVTGTELDPDAPLPTASYNASQTGSSGSTLNGVSFVMIYNPLIYDENDPGTTYRTSLSTGTFGSQIVTGLNRAGELEEPTSDREMISPRDTLGDFDNSRVARESGRAGAADPIYHQNSTHDFFAGCGYERSKRSFTCLYEGANCYIWSQGTAITAAQAEKVGKTFDELIYPTDVNYFGRARFTESGGKINILFYPMSQAGLCGFFHLYDIFSTSELAAELTQQEIEYYGFNADHAIININSSRLSFDEKGVLSTIAHELQHLICASDNFYYMNTPDMRTWLNESMSAYAEELNYPGIKEEEEVNLTHYVSESFRNGQSLYDFENKNDSYYGEYGTVYLFSRYIEKYAGSDVYSKIHSYWRDSYSADISEASALHTSVPATFAAQIDSAYAYPATLSARFANKDDEWMSKLTLDFFLETVKPDLANAAAYVNGLRLYMLYDQVNPVSIEGGGRVLIATENGSYTIPSDADKGLIYIGFDANFNPVTVLYPGA